MAKQKAVHPQIGWEEVIRKDLKEIGIAWEDVKRDALNILGWRRSVFSFLASEGSCCIKLLE